MSTKEMPPGEMLGGEMREAGLTDDGDAELGVSKSMLERGYSTDRVPGVPPKTVEFDGERFTNYERMAVDPKTGKLVDAYAGGFLKRTPWNPNER